MASFQRLWAAAETAEAVPPPARDAAELRALDAKRARLVSLVEDGHGDVEALLERLRVLERQIRELRESRVEAPTRPEPVPLPDLSAIVGQLDDLEALILSDACAGRAVLEARFANTTLTPRDTPDGPAYHLETTLKTAPAALVSEDGRKFCGVGGCGGLQDVWESPAPGPLSLFLPRIRGAIF